MKKRIISLLLCLCLAVGLLAGVTAAEDHTHTWDEGVITLTPSCSRTGIKTYTCTECGETYTEPLPYAHDWDEGYVYNTPTCGRSGRKLYTCIKCGETYEEELPALPHTWDDGVIEPACLNGGTSYKIYTCIVCGATQSEELPDVTHLWDEGVEKYAAGSRVVDGRVQRQKITIYTCTACDATRTVRGEWEDIGVSDPEPATVTVGSVRGRSGTHVAVPISISDNPGIACARFAVGYDASVLTLTGITVGDDLYDCYYYYDPRCYDSDNYQIAFTSLTYTQPGDLTANPINLLWDGLHNDTSNGLFAMLWFDIADSAPEGDYPITVTYEEDDIINEYPQNVPVTVESGTVTVWNVLIGDVNGDEKINTKDLLFMRQYFAGGYGVTPVRGAADLDGDGHVAAKDLLMLRQYLAGGYGIVLNEQETQWIPAP